MAVRQVTSEQDKLVVFVSCRIEVGWDRQLQCWLPGLGATALGDPAAVLGADFVLAARTETCRNRRIDARVCMCVGEWGGGQVPGFRVP